MGNIIDSAKTYLLSELAFKKSLIIIGDDINSELSAVLDGTDGFAVFTQDKELRCQMRRTFKDQRINYLTDLEQIKTLGDAVCFDSLSFKKYIEKCSAFIQEKKAVVVSFFNIDAQSLDIISSELGNFAAKKFYKLKKNGSFYGLYTTEDNIVVGDSGVAVFHDGGTVLSPSYIYRENTSDAEVRDKLAELERCNNDREAEISALEFTIARMRNNSYQILGPIRVVKNILTRIMRKFGPTNLLLKFAKALLEGGTKTAVARVKSYLGIRKIREQNEDSFTFYKNEYVDFDSEYQQNIDFSDNKTDVKMLAYYLPQYHSFKENDEWWGKGFTEWNNTRVCRPRFSGHYQPRTPHNDIGYYDLSNIETLRRQAKLARQHGIYGFCFYYYWFSGKRLMEKPVDMLLEHPEIDLPFCLCWANENWTRAWDGQNKHVLIAQDYSADDDERFMVDMKKYIDDKRYIRIGGKPLVVVYNPGQIPDCSQSFGKWREVARKIGIGEILIWTCQTANNTAEILHIEDCIDAEVEFPPHNTWLRDFAITDMNLHGQSATIMNYQKLVEGWLQIFKRGDDKGKSKKPIHHTCMMAWDNAARRKKNWFTYHCFSLKSLYDWVTLICAQARRDFNEEERFVFINAWNEWAEGTYLEPDEKYGYANINTVSKALMGIPFKDDIEFIDNNSSGVDGGRLNKKIAVQIHMFYTETMDETIKNLNMMPYNFDCFISTDSKDKADAISAAFNEKCRCKNCTVELFENRGRDVAPFIIQMADRIDEYDYICHIHSKKTATADHGNDWRKYIFRHLFGSSEYLKRLFALFENDFNLGIVFPETFPVLEYQAEWGGNLKGVRELLETLNIYRTYPQDPIFPVGNMFWAKTEAVRPLFKAGIGLKDFAEEAGQVNATLAHCIERSWVYVAQEYGFKYLKVMNNCADLSIPDKKRIAFYVHYNKDNILSDEDYDSLKAYSKIFDKIVVISNSDLCDDDVKKIREFTDDVLFRENKGFDFAAWKFGLESYGYENIRGYDEMALINNSTYSPVLPLQPVFREMNERGDDFWGITLFPGMSDGSYIGKSCIPEHLQSYFIVFGKKIIESGEIKRFFDDLKFAETFTDAVANGEVELTQHMKRCGFTYSPYLMESYYICSYLGSMCVPYDKAASLVLLGSPFVKKKCVNYMAPPEAAKLKYILSKLENK